MAGDTPKFEQDRSPKVPPQHLNAVFSPYSLLGQRLVGYGENFSFDKKIFQKNIIYQMKLEKV